MTKHRPGEPVLKRFQPDASLVQFIDDRYWIAGNHYDQLMRRANVSEPLATKISRAKVRKLRVLESKIFPSMANLVYFFEAIADSDSLLKLLDEDVKDLLRIGIAEKSHPRLVNRGNIGDEDHLPVARLVSAILLLDSFRLVDYRLKIAHRIQSIIAEKALAAIETRYGHESQVFLSALSDMKSAIGWTRFAAEMADSERERDMRRAVNIPNLPGSPMKGTTSDPRVARKMIRNISFF